VRGSEDPWPLLTEGQRRHLEGSLRQLDSEIEEAILWFRESSPPGADTGRIVAALEAVGGTVRETAEELGLTLNQAGPDPSRRLAALAGHWWGLALDCRSRALRGYGEVDPRVAAVVDPLVNRLAAELLGLGGQAEEPEE
jgi:hypothetical protein